MKLRPLMFLVILCPLMATHAFAGKKKKKEPPAPLAGWNQVEGQTGACYHPPSFEEMGSGSKRIAWQDTRNEIMGQWQGERGDGVQFDNVSVVNMETALLAEADRIDAVSKENLKHCLVAMSSGSTAAWSAWFDDLYGKLTEGECPWPKFNSAALVTNYLNLNLEWQNAVNLCKGDRVRIKVSDFDFYRLHPKGQWMQVDGSGEPASANAPCTLPECTEGMVVYRFRGESMMKTVGPIGFLTVFEALEHGTLDLMINDDDLADNLYKVEGGLEHHAIIEYTPAKD